MPNDTDDSDTDRLADRFEQCRDDEPTGYTPAAFGKAGIGKTHQIGTELAHRLTDDTESVGFVDLKRNKGNI